MQTLSRALNRLKAGGMVLLVDDEDRENEGDLVVAAEFATPEAIAFMARKACGLICLALTRPADRPARPFPYGGDEPRPPLDRLHRLH